MYGMFLIFWGRVGDHPKADVGQVRLWQALSSTFRKYLGNCLHLLRSLSFLGASSFLVLFSFLGLSSLGKVKKMSKFNGLSAFSHYPPVTPPFSPWLRKREITGNGHNSAHDKKLKKLTLISQNLKVEENIVHLLFTIFSFSVNHVNKVLSLNLENGYISASEPKLKKLRAPCFLKLLKLKKFKCLQFFQFWLRVKIQPFSHFLSTTSTRCHPQSYKMAISEPRSQKLKKTKGTLFFFQTFKVEEKTAQQIAECSKIGV